jgi:hypothetical protein
MRYLIEEQKPRIFVELGSHNGFSYFAACEKARELDYEHNFYAIDTWEGDAHTGAFESSVYSKVKSINSYYLNESSLLRTTFNQAVEQFQDSSIDLLHIDGFHTEEAVTEDFKNWLPKMSNNGIVILHDISVLHQDFGVYKLWNTLKDKYVHLEFPHSYGLGVVFLGEAPSNGLKKLIRIGDVNRQFLYQGVFAAHGDGILQAQLRIYESEIRQLHLMSSQVKVTVKELDFKRRVFELLPRKIRALIVNKRSQFGPRVL